MIRLKISQSDLWIPNGRTTYNVKVNEDGTVSMLDSGYYLNGDSTGNDLGIDQNLFDSMKEIAKESKETC